MKLFLKRSRGSITVLVTLILIPTIFFAGFLVDLARLKLYSDQAVMTADNYGEMVLSQYDNVLKELYGLFSVTQDVEALEQLDQLQAYMKTSFNPADQTISWEHLQAVLGPTTYNGFMPYQNAEIKLDYDLITSANLRSNEILSTQVGDFMKFRIVQQLAGDGTDLLGIMSKVENMESDSSVVAKKLELDETAQDLYELAREYYVILNVFTQYPDYIKEINTAYSGCKGAFSNITLSDSYQVYYKYETCNHDAMQRAVEKRDRIEEESEEPSEEEELSEREESESLSDEEKELVQIHDDYENDTNARRDQLAERFDAAIGAVSASLESEPINFNRFDTKLAELKAKAEEIVSKGADLERLRQELEGLLEEDVTVELKTGVQEELSRLDELFVQMKYYRGIAVFIEENDTAVNAAYQSQVNNIISRLNEIKAHYLDCEEGSQPDWRDSLDESRWEDFRSKNEYKSLYDSLDQCFGREGDENMGEQKKKAAETMLADAEAELDQNEASGARDIPESFHYGMQTNSVGGFHLSNMAREAVGYFSVNHLVQGANRLLLKFYMIEYDFGMFSSRVTNIKDDKNDSEEGDTGASQHSSEVSLTGYEKAANINYLYQAELEYLLGGYRSSDDNLASARNQILAFRAIVNFAATYSVEQVNSAIKTISDIAGAINPVLGIAVSGALRLAVAGVETAADWEELKKGNSVELIKDDLAELTSYKNKKIRNLLGISEEQGGNNSSDFRVDYEQCLLVMLVFFTSAEEVTQRTADLIELNVNTVIQGIGSEGTLTELKFQMKDAYTAVNAMCSVHLDFAVMPWGFAKLVASEETYDAMVEFQKSSYRFTVTRSY